MVIFCDDIILNITGIQQNIKHNNNYLYYLHSLFALKNVHVSLSETKEPKLKLSPGNLLAFLVKKILIN